MIKKNGFTFIEAITVVGIICILATLSVVAMKSLRMSGRDSRRVSDITEIRNALSLYYSKYNQYPTSITPGESFKAGSVIYLEKVPSNPVPRNDGTCNSNDYAYIARNNNSSYSLNFCLGNGIAGIQAGNNQATPNDISSYIPPEIIISLDRDWTSELGDGDKNGYTVFNVMLSTKPADTVFINMTISDYEGRKEASLSSDNIKFTTDDWNQIQKITVAGINDNFLEDAGTSYTINFQSTSNDNDYNNMAVAPLALTNNDECGDGGNGNPGPEKGKCLSSMGEVVCKSYGGCPNLFYCASGASGLGDLCGEGQQCWRNSDCMSNICDNVNPPSPGSCAPIQ